MSAPRAVSAGTPQPFFAVPSAPGGGARRMLLISYSFPPDHAIGALRWQKLAPFVAAHGWELDVVMCHPADLERTDPSRLDELPLGTRLFGAPHRASVVERWQRSAIRAYRRVRPRAPAANGDLAPSMHREEISAQTGGVVGLKRSYLAWQRYASEGRWARLAAELGHRVVQPGVHDVVVTSGPPHMAHLAGADVAARAGLPLVIDMRDPWSLRHRLAADVASPVALRLADRYERQAVSAADLVVLNTEPLRRGMAEKYPEAAARMITAMNGADAEELPSSRFGHRFSLAFAGTIYVDRDPRPLLRAARRVVHELGLTPADFGVDFIGNAESYGGVPVDRMAAEEGLAEYVTVGGPRPRREALEFLTGAQMLVSLPQDGTMQIPAKIFEYLNFPAWLLVFAEPGSAPDLLLRGSGADVLPLGDEERTAAAIRERYLQYRRGERPPALNAGGRFSRATQARVLLDAIEGVVKKRAGVDSGARL